MLFRRFLFGCWFERLLEAAMTKVLVACLLTAFAVNVACLPGHL